MNLDTAQLGIIDMQAMIWAIAAALTPPNPRLTSTKPTMRLCSLRIMVPIVEVIVLAAVTQMACFLLMKSQDWYHGGNGLSDQVCICLHNFNHVLSILHCLCRFSM